MKLKNRTDEDIEVDTSIHNIGSISSVTCKNVAYLAYHSPGTSRTY